MKVVCFKILEDQWQAFHKKYGRKVGQKLREFIINDLGYNESGKSKRVRDIMERS